PGRGPSPGGDQRARDGHGRVERQQRAARDRRGIRAAHARSAGDAAGGPALPRLHRLAGAAGRRRGRGLLAGAAGGRRARGALRARVAEERGRPEWLRELQDLVADQRQYEHSSLVEVQGWSRVPRGEPLFESLYLFERFPGGDEEPDLGGELRVRVAAAFEPSTYPLTLMAGPGPRA